MELRILTADRNVHGISMLVRHGDVHVRGQVTTVQLGGEVLMPDRRQM